MRKKSIQVNTTWPTYLTNFLFLQEIYSWDSGNQLNYPVVYIDIGYNTGDDDQRGVLSIPDYQYDFQIERNELSRARYGGQDGDGAVLSNDVYIPGSS